MSIDEAKREIELLRDIQPHAVITTNYDRFFEPIFNSKISDGNLLKDAELNEKREDIKDEGISSPSYRVVIGEQVLRTRYRNIGEIIHIHGAVPDPNSLILTKEDYREFNNRRRYLSSKMLTYFAEHPLLIIGYQPNDPNVQQVISWADEVLGGEKSITNDIFLVQYKEDVDKLDEYPKYHDIHLEDGGHLRVKGIVAKEFDWIFEAFAAGGDLEVDPRYLRSLLAQTYEVVTSSPPQSEVVDVSQLEDIATDEDELRTVLGIYPEGTRDLPPLEFDHTYRPSDAAEEIGLDGYQNLNDKVIDKIDQEKGVNIKSFNNRYHIAFFSENVTPRRYSEEAIELFRKVKEGKEYTLDIPDERIPND
ncbi:SIR2 family NAD-dependent protein deacylase [Salinibacter altiplanensis]|uniref:SIR2 family NAD-dependent protein deacylase n=1 Tax=Salinibacter altiplanensis TaxID=1803181 RepID=UPI0018F8996E|nr:SIR2 family protein [Salinibacter altiplanensis]